MLVSDGSSKFVHVRKLVFKSSQKFELPYLLVLLSFTLHLFCIPCSSTKGNISSEIICKSTYMCDRVNKCTAKYFTYHGWTNCISPRDRVDLHFVRDMPSNCVKHKPDAWCMAGDFFLLLQMTDLDKLKSKREIIMEKECMIPVNKSMVYNHCKNL